MVDDAIHVGTPGDKVVVNDFNYFDDMVMRIEPPLVFSYADVPGHKNGRLFERLHTDFDVQELQWMSDSVPLYKNGSHSKFKMANKIWAQMFIKYKNAMYDEHAVPLGYPNVRIEDNEHNRNELIGQKVLYDMEEYQKYNIAAKKTTTTKKPATAKKSTTTKRST
jgi:hypothetical protein